MPSACERQLPFIVMLGRRTLAPVAQSREEILKELSKNFAVFSATGKVSSRSELFNRGERFCEKNSRAVD